MSTTSDNGATQPPNTNRYVEDVGIGFAIYCDEHELSLSAGLKLAERIAEQLSTVADDRADYLPEHLR